MTDVFPYRINVIFGEFSRARFDRENKISEWLIENDLEWLQHWDSKPIGSGGEYCVMFKDQYIATEFRLRFG